MCPAVITDVSDDSKLMQEETFGPVTCIVPFKTEEEVCCLVCPPLTEASNCRSELLMCLPWRLGNVVVGKDGGEGKKRGREGSMEERGRREGMGEGEKGECEKRKRRKGRGIGNLKPFFSNAWSANLCTEKFTWQHQSLSATCTSVTIYKELLLHVISLPDMSFF